MDAAINDPESQKKSANVRKWYLGEIPKTFLKISDSAFYLSKIKVETLLFNKIGQWDFSFEVQKATFYPAAMAIGY